MGTNKQEDPAGSHFEFKLATLSPDHSQTVTQPIKFPLPKDSEENPLGEEKKETKPNNLLSIKDRAQIGGVHSFNIAGALQKQKKAGSSKNMLVEEL